jgi:hypothetical protein
MGLLTLVFWTLTCSKSCLELLIRRSPPQLFTAAARTGLEPAPESRSRWACHHLLRSFTMRLSVHCFEPLSVPLQHTLLLGVAFLRGVDTPSLQAQGGQRRPLYFNKLRDFPHQQLVFVGVQPLQQAVKGDEACTPLKDAIGLRDGGAATDAESGAKIIPKGNAEFPACVSEPEKRVGSRDRCRCGFRR